jgi:hypothetical protein
MRITGLWHGDMFATVFYATLAILYILGPKKYIPKPIAATDATPIAILRNVLLFVGVVGVVLLAVGAGAGAGAGATGSPNNNVFSFETIFVPSGSVIFFTCV